MDKLTDALFVLTLSLVVLVLTIESVTSVHLVLAYLFLVAIAFNQYDHHVHDGISPLFSLQVALTFALGTIVIVLVVGGLGFRALELAAVFLILLVFVLVRDDILNVLPTTLPYLAAFGVLFAIFLYHAAEFGAGSGTGLFPVFAGIILAFNLFVLPRYVSAEAVYRSVGAIATVVAALGLLVVPLGEYSALGFEVAIWRTQSVPLFGELPVIQSVFANPNTLGVLLFPGLVAAYITTHRTLASADYRRAVVPGIAFVILAAGLYLSNSRASMLAAAVAIAVYTLATTDRRLIPVGLLGVGAVLVTVMALIYVSVLPIDPANRFVLWRAGIDAVRFDGTLLGEGIISTREAIEPYLAEDVGTFTSHNSYLSMFIRAGILGGLAYCLLVLGPICHAVVRYERVNVGMFSIVAGFAVHQFFEGYTLYQFGPGSILGALAIGYVIASLAGGENPMSTANETERETEDPKPRSTVDRFGYERDVQYQTESHDDRL